MADAMANLRIAYGEDNLAAFKEVAGHPVGTPAVDFVVAAVGKIKNAAVLEETANYRAHTNVLAYPRDPRTNGTDSAHDQVNLHAGLRSLVEGFNHCLLKQR